MLAVVLLCALRAAAWSPAPRAARAWASSERARSLPATREGSDPEVTIRHLTEDLQDARDELEASRALFDEETAELRATIDALRAAAAARDGGGGGGGGAARDGAAALAGRVAELERELASARDAAARAEATAREATDGLAAERELARRDGAAARATIDELLARVAAAETAAAAAAAGGGEREARLEAQVRELVEALEHQQGSMAEIAELRARYAETRTARPLRAVGDGVTSRPPPPAAPQEHHVPLDAPVIDAARSGDRAKFDCWNRDMESFRDG